jgi:hypothetical protein
MMDSLHGAPAKAVNVLLDRLPLQDPDPALGQPIQTAHVQRRRRRRQHRSWMGASLAAAALLLVFLWPRTAQLPDGAGAISDWQANSRMLEQAWHASGRATMDPRLRAELNLIDLQLQAAYDRGAADAELAPLWKLRSETLQELLSDGVAPVLAVTRI